jgi:hypothetical protein
VSNDTNNLAYGFNSPLINVFPSPIVVNFVPDGSTIGFQPGQVLINTNTAQAFITTGTVSNIANWVGFAGGSDTFSTVTATTGNITTLNTTTGNITTVNSTTDNAVKFNAVGAGTNVATGFLAQNTGASAVQPGSLVLQKTRGASGVITAGDQIGTIVFEASDGTTPTLNTANIIALNNGAISAGFVPTDLLFQTSGVATTVTTRATISHLGGVSIALPDAATTIPLAVNSANTVGTPGVNVLNAIAGATSPGIVGLQKTRVGGATVVTGDQLGEVRFMASDGTTPTLNIANVIAVANGTISAGFVPTDLQFQTSGAAQAVITRATISNLGGMTIAAPDAATTSALIVTANAAGNSPVETITCGATTANIYIGAYGVTAPTFAAPVGSLAINTSVTASGSGTGSRLWVNIVAAGGGSSWTSFTSAV